VLRLFILTLHDQPGREVRYAYRGVSGIDALSARARRAEPIDPQFVWIDFDIDFLRLGKHRNRDRGSVNAALGLGGRDTLHAVHPALVAKSPERLLALDVDDDLANPASIGVRNRKRLDLPAARLRVTAIHPIEVSGKERGFVSTGPRANLQDRVLFLVWILRNEQQTNLALHRDLLFFEFRKLDLGEFAHFAVVVLEHGPGVCDCGEQPPIASTRFGERAHSREFLGYGREFSGGSRNAGISELLLELTGLRFES
jgi:hypothetical protein